MCSLSRASLLLTWARSPVYHKVFFITKFLWKSEGVDAWGFSNDDKWWSDDTLVSMIQNLLVKSEEKGEQKFCTGDVFSLKNILKMGDINVL